MKNKIRIITVNTDLLVGATYNPRSWSDESIKDLTESITKYGIVDPIIVNGAKNRKNIVIGGHFRLHVAKLLGFLEVPVVYIDLPDVEKEKELNLRLNKNTGSWDYELLRDFDIELLMDIGFDDSDLSHIWDDQLGVEDDTFNVQNELNQIIEPKTKRGEIYQLGTHRLICGDATDHKTIQKLCGGKQASMVYCDPPYNISLDYNKGVGNKSNYGGTTQDRKSATEYKAFLTKTIENALQHASSDTHLFYWCDEKNIGLVQEIYKELGIENKRVCLWIKNNFNVTPNVAFNKVYEPCVYGTIGSPYLATNVTKYHEILNKEVDSGNRAIDDIIDLFNIWLVKRIPTQDYEHPTEKPSTLHEKPLKRCTKPGDIVLDLFGGSGSTMMACEQLNRACYMVEIEPIFCDLIIRRYQQLTGKEAVLWT